MRKDGIGVSKAVFTIECTQRYDQSMPTAENGLSRPSYHTVPASRLENRGLPTYCLLWSEKCSHSLPTN